MAASAGKGTLPEAKNMKRRGTGLKKRRAGKN
jgi:hypothetical protein